MAEATIDKLQIEISSNAEQVKKGLSSLQRSLKSISKLSGDLKKINSEVGSRLTKIADGVTALSKAAGGSNLSAAVKNLRALGKLNFDGFARGLDYADVSKLRDMAEALRGFGNIQAGVNALRSIGKLDLTNLSISLGDIPADGAAKLRDLAQGISALSGAEGGVNVLRALGRIDLSTFGASMSALPADAGAKLSGLAQGLSGLSTANPAALSNVTRGIKNQAASALDIKPLTKTTVAPRTVDTKSFTNVAAAAKAAADAIRQNIPNSVKTAIKALNKIGRVGAKSFSLIAKGAIGTVSGIAKLVKGTVWVIAKLVKALRGGEKAADGFNKKMDHFRRVIVGTLGYAALYGIISAISNALREGTENLYNYSQAIGSSFAADLDALASSFQYLKNSVAAAAAPLLQSLAPAIDFVIDKAVALFNVLNQVFARLAGASSWTKAVRATTSFGEAASRAGKAAKDAGGAAKDMAMAFDELNVLSDSGGGGGGGGGGDGGGIMFEEVPIDSEIANFVDALKQAIEAGDWEGAGRILGQKVNELVESVDWYAQGVKFGRGMQNAIDMIYGFLDEVDWQNIGASIAEFLNGAVDKVDTSLVGATFATKINSILTAAYNAASTFDWQKLGDKIVAGIKAFADTFEPSTVYSSFNSVFGGILNAANTVVANIPWSQLGSKIAETLNGINWTDHFSGIGKALSNFLLGLADFVGTILTDTDWESIGAGIVSLFENIDWAAQAEKWGDVANKLGAALMDALIALFTSDTNLNGIPGWAEAVLGIAYMIGKVITEAVDGILGTDFFSNAWDKIWNIFFDPLNMGTDSMTMPKTVQEYMAQKMSEQLGIPIEQAMAMVADDAKNWSPVIVDGVVVGIEPKLPEYKSSVSGLLGEGTEKAVEDAAKAAQDSAPDITLGVATGIESAAPELDSTTDKVLVKDLMMNFEGSWQINSPSQVMDDNGVYLVQGLYNGIDTESPTITTLLTAMSVGMIGLLALTWLTIQLAVPVAWALINAAIGLATNTAVTTATNNIKTMVDIMANVWTDINNGIPAGWTPIIAALKQSISRLTSDAMNGFNALKSNIQGVWSSIGSYVDSACDRIIASVRSMASAVSSAISSMSRSLNSFSTNAARQISKTQSKIDSINIPGFAGGGMPDTGQLFVARERGPELVGAIGNKTAVANNDQIIDGIRAGVAEAMRETQGNNGGAVEVRVYLDGRQITASVEKHQRSRGVNMYPGGVLSGV